MYHYNKSRGRPTLSPKDNHLLGPQFSLQASATTVSERPNNLKQQQGFLGSQHSIPVKNHETFGSSSPVPKRSTSSQHSESGISTYSQNSDRSSQHHHHLHSQAHPTRASPSPQGSPVPQGHHHLLRAHTLGKRHTLQATALAHDLPHPDMADDGRSIHQTISSHGSVARIGKTPMYLPGDRVVFAESPSSPGVPIVYRTPEERSANPDRLNLDRRRLVVCPLLEGEDQLRLLNYQHNMISRIQHLNGLRRLIFLDLYDNQIEQISGLNSLKSLRVLMLGKNRIRRIENLDTLTKLDVLDLHGNQINKIENLNHLGELRVLNLAGNVIECVDNLGGMEALTELNLRRNHISVVSDVECLPSLQRLFLSFNEITCFDDIGCLADSHSLAEISLDGTPFASESHYKQTVLRNMLQLRQLDMKRITEDERRIASVMARKEEDKKRETNKIAIMKQHRYERRRLAINNARRQWEVMQGSMMQRTNKIVGNNMPDLVANHVANVSNQDYDGSDKETESSRSSSIASRPTSAKSLQSDRGEWDHRGRPMSSSGTGTRSTSLTRDSQDKNSGKVTISGPVDSNSSLNVDYLAELEGDTLSLYGPGSLDALDKNWGIAAAGAVVIVNFKFIDFDDISKQLHKIRARFPSVHTLVFNSTNIHSLCQFNALSAMRRLESLMVDPEGNAVTQYSLWKNYVLFRLAHFSLKKINDVDVSATDIVNAEKFFGPLAHITTSQLPQARLVSLLGENKKKQLLASEDKNRKSPDVKNLIERSSGESVGRAGLVYTSPEVLQQKAHEQKSRREFVHSYITELTRDSIMVDQKRNALRKIWSQVFLELVYTAVLEMWDSQTYMKKCMEKLTQEKS